MRTIRVTGLPYCSYNFQHVSFRWIWSSYQILTRALRKFPACACLVEIMSYVVSYIPAMCPMGHEAKDNDSSLLSVWLSPTFLRAIWAKSHQPIKLASDYATLGGEARQQCLGSEWEDPLSVLDDTWVSTIVVTGACSVCGPVACLCPSDGEWMQNSHHIKMWMYPSPPRFTVFISKLRFATVSRFIRLSRLFH
jgi:hypothetical protein